VYDYSYYLAEAKRRIEREGGYFDPECFELENELNHWIRACVVLFVNNEYRSIVIAEGGYKERIFPMLKDYNTIEKVGELINKGGIIKQLFPEINKCEPQFPENSYQVHECVEEVFSVFEDCYYLFKDGKWNYATIRNKQFTQVQ
jgi:hypothetical protein